METFLKDLRYGLRMIRSNLGFSAVAIIALALGIGANTAIFSVVNSLLLQPLAYKEPDRLVSMNHNYPKLKLKASVSAIGYQHYRDNNQSFEDISAFTGWPANLTETGEPERIQGLLTTASFFSTLGVNAAKGRLFQSDEEQAGRNKVVVIGDSLWKRRFGSDEAIIGQTLKLNGEPYEVIGIAPANFKFGSELGQPTEIWAPIAFTQDQLQTQRWRNEFLSVVARLKPGISLELAQAEMDAIASNVRETYFGGGDASDPSSWGLLLQSMNEVIVGEIRPMLLMLMAAVGLVLLIACANVANLLLARAAARQKEIAIRTALGAGRRRIIRQLLTESVLLALLGGALGTPIAFWGLQLLVSINEANIPRAGEIGIDYRVLLFTLLVSLVTGVVFGLVPALQTAKSDLHDTLKEGGRSGSAGTRKGIRGALVVTEMAISMLLLIGAGLFIKSFLKLQDVSPGFRPENLLVMQTSLPSSRYRQPHEIDGFYQAALQNISSLPGVVSTGVSTAIPMSGSNSSGSFRIENRNVNPGEMSPWGNRWFAGPGYFETMGIPLIRGRFFEDRDVADGKQVAIIDETMMNKFWPDEDPIGRRISFQRDAQGNTIWREVVGVVGHVRHLGLEGESPVQYYLPHRQIPINSVFIVSRTTGEPSALAASVRSAIRSVDSELPVFRVTSMEQMVSDSMARRRFSTTLLGIFAATALLLAAVGLYGVMSYSVTQRVHEIGIRMALGAGSREVVKMMLGHGMLLSAIGLAIGLCAAFVATRWIVTLLFGVSATDPLIYVGIAAFLALVAALATYIPARRAARVDPMIALRYE